MQILILLMKAKTELMKIARYKYRNLILIMQLAEKDMKISFYSFVLFDVFTSKQLILNNC